MIWLKIELILLTCIPRVRCFTLAQNYFSFLNSRKLTIKSVFFFVVNWVCQVNSASLYKNCKGKAFVRFALTGFHQLWSFLLRLHCPYRLRKKRKRKTNACVTTWIYFFQWSHQSAFLLLAFKFGLTTDWRLLIGITGLVY